MRKQWIRFFAMALALTLALTMLPAAARADDAGHIGNADDSGKDYTLDASEVDAGYYRLASGQPGEKLTVYIPIRITDTTESVSDLSCTLAVSKNPDVFPFAASDTETQFTADPIKRWTGEKLEGWDGKELKGGERAYFQLKDKTLLSSLASGAKELSFVIAYTLGGEPCVDTIKVRVYTVTPAPSGSGGGSSSYKSKPKVIVESYDFSSDVLYAGDMTTLVLVIRNTSSREAITNLQLDFADETGAITPAPGGSNSIYIGEIAKKDYCALTIDLQIAPDAEAKPHLLALTLAYEGTKNRQDFEEKATLGVPIQQRARVRLNDPVMYDDPWINAPISVGVTVYNMGKSALYNCMVDIDAENMTLEEPYFGGNVASGATMRADLSITPLVGGEITGNVRVTYEDVYGTETVEILPLTMFVNENSDVEVFEPTPEELGGGGSGANGAFAWYWWVLIGAVVVTGLVLLLVRAKKRRARSLEDDGF